MKANHHMMIFEWISVLVDQAKMVLPPQVSNSKKSNVSGDESPWADLPGGGVGS